MQAANSAEKQRFGITVIGLGNLKEPGESGIVVLLCEIGFPERKDGGQPVGLEPGRFVKLCQLGVSIRGLQRARVLLERIQAQAPLPLGEIRQTQSVVSIPRRERPPQQARVQLHQGIHRTAFPHQWPQPQRVYAERTHLDGDGRSLGRGRIFSVDHIIRIQVFGNAQHGGAAEGGATGQAVTLQFVSSSGMRVNLLSGGCEPLNGQLFQTFAEPVESCGRAGIFEGQNHVDFFLRIWRDRARLCGRSLLRSANRRADQPKDEYCDEDSTRTGLAKRAQHLACIVAEAATRLVAKQTNP